MNLPKWTEKEQFTDRDWSVQMDHYHEALTIAWEALVIAKKNIIDSGLNEHDYGDTVDIINEAIGRIEEIGK